ncbi:MAG: hypothetical protein ACRCTR_09680 [Actinomycetota bacterium]
MMRPLKVTMGDVLGWACWAAGERGVRVLEGGGRIRGFKPANPLDQGVTCGNVGLSGAGLVLGGGCQTRKPAGLRVWTALVRVKPAGRR